MVLILFFAFCVPIYALAYAALWFLCGGRMAGTIAPLITLIVAFGCTWLYGWRRWGRYQSSKYIEKNREHLFDLHLKSCREYIEAIESEGGKNELILKVKMAMIHDKLRDALRVGYSSDEQLAAHSDIRRRFLALEREHGLDFRDYEL